MLQKKDRKLNYLNMTTHNEITLYPARPPIAIKSINSSISNKRAVIAYLKKNQNICLKMFLLVRKLFHLPQRMPDTKVAEIGASVLDFFLKKPKIKPSTAIDLSIRGIT